MKDGELKKTGSSLDIKPSKGDRAFVAYLNEGFSKRKAFEMAYADENETLHKYMVGRDLAIKQKNNGDYRRFRDLITSMALDKFKSKKIKLLDEVYSNKMNAMAFDAVDVMEDLMHNSKSDMVKADVAKTVFAYKEGTPIQRSTQAVQGVVQVIVGSPAEDKRDPIKVQEMKRIVEEDGDVKNYDDNPKRDYFTIDSDDYV